MRIAENLDLSKEAAGARWRESRENGLGENFARLGLEARDEPIDFSKLPDPKGIRRFLRFAIGNCCAPKQN